MARSRNIKPGLFKNEVLGVAEPIYTLAFEGLWLQADREGRIEDRPLRIKAETFPYRDGIDMDAILNWLQDQKFILRYEVSGKRFIQVLNFRKHQNPHKNETESDIPPPEESERVPNLSEQEPSKSEALGLIPCSLIPDSLSTDVPGDTRAPEGNKKEPQGFPECWKIYPKRQGGNSRSEALKAYRARLKSGVLPEDLLSGVTRYAAFIRGTGKEGTEFVKQAASFFGTGEHWREPWALATAEEAGSYGTVNPFRGAI